MDLGEYQAIGSELMQLLRLENPPVAISFVDTPPRGAKKNKESVAAGCVFWIRGFKDTFYTDQRDHANCNIGSFTHGFLAPEKVSLDDCVDIALFDKTGYFPAPEFGGGPRASEGQRRSRPRSYGDAEGEVARRGAHLIGIDRISPSPVAMLKSGTDSWNPNESLCPDAGRADQDRGGSREDPGQRGWRRQVHFGRHRHRTIRHRLPMRRPRPQGHLHLRPEMLLCRGRSEDDDLSCHVTGSRFALRSEKRRLSHRSRTLRAESSAGGKVRCSL